LALRQLLISKKIEQRKNALAELLIQEEELQKRSETLEAAATEAQTDEELAAVEEEVGKLEAQKGELEQKKSKLHGEIAELEAELEQLNAKPPADEHRSAQPPEPQPAQQQFEYRGEKRMSIFRNLNQQERAALIAREDVKSFLQRARELAGVSQTRSVSGTELTIPDVFLELLRDNLDRYSKLLKYIRVRPLKGRARENILGAYPEAIWMEAKGALNELELLFNQISVDGYMVGGFIPVHNNDLNDSDENLAGIILDALGQAIGFAVDKAILYGTGKKMPLGIVTRLAQTAEPDNWPEHAPAWTDLHTSNIVKIDPNNKTAQEFYSELILKAGIPRPNYAGNSPLFWAMSRKTKMKLVSKALMFNAAGAIVAGVNNTLPVIGGDIVELDFIPENDIIGGFGWLYLLVEREGSKFAASEHVRFLQNQTVYKGYARYDGAPVFGESFVVININNSSPTTTIPFAPDTANPQDAYLKELKIGNKTLTPTFASDVFEYAAATTDASNTVTATPAKSGATVTIDVDGTPVQNGGSATWSAGENTVTITVQYGTTSQVYTVVVTKS